MTCDAGIDVFLSVQLALTAASPLWRGYIADVDCRWDVIAASVDDRTEEERGLKVRPLGRSYIHLDTLIFVLTLVLIQPLKENKFRIPKSRYGSVSLYISEEWMNKTQYNDIDAPYDEAIFDRLRGHGKRRTPFSLLFLTEC